MALTAKFVADFTSFQEGVRKAEVTLKGFEGNANKVGASLNRMTNSFSGTKIIQDATLMSAAVQKAGGIATLTDKQLRSLNATVSEAAEKMRKMGIEVPQGFKNIQDAASNLDKPLGDMNKRMVAIGTAIGTFLAQAAIQAGRAMIAAGKAAFEYADALTNLSVATGVTIGGLQRIEALGTTTGVSMETLANSVGMLQKNLDNPAAKKALADMGLNYQHIRNLKPEDQFLEIAKSVAAIQDPVEKANAGAALFGRQWMTIAPAITGDIDKIVQGVRTLSDEQVKALDTAGDAWDKWKRDSQRSIASYLGTLVLASQKGNIAMRDLLSPQLALQKLIRGGVADAADWEGNLPKVAAPKMDLPTGMGATSWEEIEAIVERTTDQINEAIAVGKKHAEEQERQNEKVIASLERVRITHFRLGEAAVMASRNVAGFGIRISETVSIGNDYSKTLTAAQIKSDSFGHALNVNVMPSLKGIGGAAHQAGLLIEEAGTKAVGFGKAMESIFSGKGFSDFGKALKGGLGDIKTGIFEGFGNLISGGIASLVSKGLSLIGTGIKKLFNIASEESTKVSPLRDVFFIAAGGLEKLNEAAFRATGSLSLVKAIFDAKTVEQYNKAITELNAALDFSAKAISMVDETAKKYGITLEEMGPAWQRQQLDKKAQELFQDYQVLIAAGLEHTLVLEKMSTSVNEYVNNALKMGIEVPSAMKPMLEAMVKNGQLVDANGNKIENLEDAGISFAMTMTEGFQSLITEVKKLTDAISRGLGLAIRNIPDGDFEIHGEYNIPPPPKGYDLPDYSVPNGGGEYQSAAEYANGGMVPGYARGGRVLHFTPRGTDTQPAMLTPGEVVLNAAQQRNLAGAIDSSTTQTFYINTIDAKSFEELLEKRGIPFITKNIRDNRNRARTDMREAIGVTA
jgi:hypothetical protein